MAKLNKHIIHKYNNAILKVLLYYNLHSLRYLRVIRGVIYLNLDEIQIGFETKERIERLHSHYPYLFPFVKFQRQYKDNDTINENVCIQYLMEINEVIKKIKQEKNGVSQESKSID